MEPVEIEQPAGAFMMIRRDAWERVGGFDEGFYPLWFEDVDFCLPLEGCRLRFFHVPAAVVMHAGAHSIRKLPLGFGEIYWYGSLLRYASKHFTPFSAQAGVQFRSSRLSHPGVRKVIPPWRLARINCLLENYRTCCAAFFFSGAGPGEFVLIRHFRMIGDEFMNGNGGDRLESSWRSSDLVSVTIVTYNSGRFIKRAWNPFSIRTIRSRKLSSSITTSTDGTIDILEPFEDRCRIVYNEENIGFAAAQNQAIGMSEAEWVLTLNPDVLLLQGFIKALVNAGNLDPRVGTVCGKLLTMTAGFDFPEKPLVDSTGIYFTPNLRHLDRGSLEVR